MTSLSTSDTSIDIQSLSKPLDIACDENIERSCSVLTHGEVFWQLTNKFNDSELFESTLLVSACMNSVFFFLMWTNKELQVHPMKLFMLITACDAYVLYSFTMATRTCELKLQKLL